MKRRENTVVSQAATHICIYYTYNLLFWRPVDQFHPFLVWSDSGKTDSISLLIPKFSHVCHGLSHSLGRKSFPLDTWRCSSHLWAKQGKRLSFYRLRLLTRLKTPHCVWCQRSSLGISRISKPAPPQDLLQQYQQLMWAKASSEHHSFLFTISYIYGHLFFPSGQCLWLVFLL